MDNEAMIEAVARAMAQADGLDWDEVCGVDTEEGFCDSGTCISAHYEEHDPEQARRWCLHIARAAINAAAPFFFDMAARYVQDNYPFDKRQLVPAIHSLKERFGRD